MSQRLSTHKANTTLPEYTGLKFAGNRWVHTYSDGTALPYIGGGDENGNGGPDENGTGGDPNGQNGTNGGGTGSEGGDPTGGEGGAGGTTNTETVSKADYEALMRRMQAADSNKSAIEKELNKLKEAQLSKEQLLEKKAQEAETKAAAAEEALRTARIENAFLANNTTKWKDGKAALKLADLSQVTVEEDGTVVGLDAALKDTATKYAFLVDDSEGGGKGGGSGSGGSPSGSGVGSGRKTTKTGEVDEAKLRAKYRGL